MWPLINRRVAITISKYLNTILYDTVLYKENNIECGNEKKFKKIPPSIEDIDLDIYDDHSAEALLLLREA